MKPRPGPILAVVALLMAVSVGIQVVRDRRYQPYTPATSLLWLQAGPAMPRLTLGFTNLVADVYWIRAVVYYGSQRRAGEGRNYDLLAPLLDVVTTLDPRFTVAYRFGALFLAEAPPAGPGRPDLSVRLLERGVAADRGRWEYLHDIGFVYYWSLQDYQQAAAWFSKAAQAPNGPSWLKPLAATTLAVGGDRRSSRVLWSQLRESSDVEWLRQTAERRLLQLDALDIIDQLNALGDRFAARAGRRPTNWPEFAPEAGLRGIPLDPTGTPFEIDPATGRVALSPKSALWPPLQEPAARQDVPPPAPSPQTGPPS